MFFFFFFVRIDLVKASNVLYLSWLEHWSYDSKVAGLNPARTNIHYTRKNYTKWFYYYFFFSTISVIII